VTQGLTEMIGGTLVFRQVGDEKIVSHAPPKRDSEESKQRKYRLAKFYGNGADTDVANKAEYAKQQEGN